MATGAADANGIWIYGEDDNESTHSALLNKLGNSVSTTVTRLEEMSGLTAAQLTAHRDNLGIGLVNIVPSSVAQAGGSASANAQGLVTFTGVTSVSLNSVFTSAYTNYRIVFDGSTGAGVAMHARMRASAADNSTANYYTAMRRDGSDGTGAAYSLTGQTYFNFGQGTTGWNVRAVIDVTSPAEASETRLTVTAAGHNGSHSQGYFGALGFSLTNQFDGITFYPASGSTTGTVQVFGYNK